MNSYGYTNHPTISWTHNLQTTMIYTHVLGATRKVTSPLDML